MKATKAQKIAAAAEASGSTRAPGTKGKGKDTRGWNPMWFDLGLLFVLVWVVYANGLHGDFVFDDQQIVLQNPVVQHIENWQDAVRAGGGWRQALYLTYGMNFLMGGLDTFNYHVTNVMIHAINVILIYFIIRKLAPPMQARTAALSGAAIFGVHTLLSSGVSYITARSSTLCALFYFSAILLFLKGRSASSLARMIGWFVLAIAGGLMALQTKQEAIALPLFLGGLVWLQSEKKDWRVLATVGALAGILAGVIFYLRNDLRGILIATSENRVLVAAGFDKVLSFEAYIRTYLTAVFEYCLPRFLVPIALSADPHIKTVEEWYSPEFIIAVVVLAGLGVLMLRTARREPLVSVGLAALLISPMAAYSIVPLADPILEYRLYIPGLGIAILAGWAALRVPWQVVAAVVLSFSVMTVFQNRAWATAVTLWEDAVRKSPDKARTHFNLGASYQNAGRPLDAIPQYQQALERKPQMWAAYSNMAALQVDQQKWKEAEELLKKATNGSPEYTEAWINLAVLYLRQGRTDDAIVAARHAVSTNEDSFAAHYNLAEALRAKASQRKVGDPNPAVADQEKLAQKEDYKDAVVHYERSVYLRPDMLSFLVTLGDAYRLAGDRDKGLQTWKELSEKPAAKNQDPNQLDPRIEALRKLATDSATTEPKDYDKAIAFLRRALELRSFNPNVHFEIGLMYYWKQQHTPAAEAFKASLAQQPNHGGAALNLAMEYEFMGKLQEGIDVLQSYLGVGPDPTQPPDFQQQARDRIAKLKAALAAKN